MSTSRGAIAGRRAANRAAAGAYITAVTIDPDAFLSSLKQAVEHMVVETEDDLVRVGLRVQASARALCPVDTGRLRSSIVMKRGRDGRGFYVEVGTSVTYAPFVEFGTSKQRAQPFLTPAIAQAAGMIAQEVKS